MPKKVISMGGLKIQPKGVESSSSVYVKLSNNQKEILEMLTTQYLTVRQIANRRKTSDKAVYKVMKKLKEKGYLTGTVMGGVEKTNPPVDLAHIIRLHGQEFNIHILTQSDRYKQFCIKKNIMQLDGCTLRLYRNSIELYSCKSFTGADAEQAHSTSMKFWHEFFLKLEQKLGIIILNGINTSIREVNAHYSEINNGLAHEKNKKGQQIRFKGEDGKTWLLTDNSFKLNELETIHPELAKEDMEKIKPFFDDLRQNPVKLSELMGAIHALAKSEGKLAEGIIAISNSLNPSAKFPQEEVKNKKIPDYIN